MVFKINQENKGKRLDVFLTKEVIKLSRSQWQKRIKDGEVTVNGRIVSKHYRLKIGEEIGITNHELKIKNKIQIPDPKLKNIKIVFEGDDYLVVSKPAGIVIHPNEMDKDNTLVDWLVGKYPEIKGVGETGRWGIVHRLDKEVSGLIVVARNREMFKWLKGQFQERKVDKEYRALVHGRMRQDEGEIKLPIGRSKAKGFFVAIGNVLDGLMRGRQAVTRYEVMKKFRNFTLIKVRILTGRTHQIRVHLRSIGHGVVGDKLYATRDVRVKKRGVDLGRLWLYAAKLGFKDLSGEWREFKIETPQELHEFLNKIK